ncbi:MAG: hypothetical protein LC674_00170, partial [Actinobacteria bacterium]|nr:hypothetical protein [Actinomycetota bacterium]
MRYDAHWWWYPELGGGFVQLVDQLIAYEEGQITEDEEIALFQYLIDTGTCWHLQGHYQRVAATLIEAGLI